MRWNTKEQLLEALWGKTHPQFERHRRRWTKLLLSDGVERIIAQARQTVQGQANAPAVESALGYFEHNTARMQYGSFRREQYFIGSGVIEAGCKTVVGSRCKQSAMFWSTSGAEHILALRCIHQSPRTDLFWIDRLNEAAARNDPLPLAA
jgi:hypothetical protein